MIIIGGGFGGLEVANRLDRAKVQTVLIDRYNHHCFQPLLYQVATSGLETGSIVFPFRRLYAGARDFYFRLGEVNQIEPELNTIHTSIGTLTYDYLVLAHGVTTNFYGMEDVEKHSFPMKTIIDAIKLRNIIIRNFEQALLAEEEETRQSLMDFVIVGGGPTGVELAGALSELKSHVFPRDYPELDIRNMDIHLVEAMPKLLNGMSEAASRKALEYLTKMGVEVHLNTAVKSYDGRKVVYNTGASHLTKTLIWAAGIKGSPIPGLPETSIGTGARYVVDQYNRVKGFENIFAIGDAALMEEEPDYPKGHPQMAPPAIQQGKRLAKNVVNLIENRPLKAFHYSNKGSMATVGRNRAVVDLIGFKTQGFVAWLIWMFVHLVSIIGFKNKFFVLISWLWSYFSYDKSNRLIIARPRDGVQ